MLRAATALAVALALVACGPAPAPSTTVYPSATAFPTWSALPTGTPGPGLGAFPRLPTTELPIDVAAALQAILNEAVDTLDAPGVAAAVIVADRGTWAGAAGTAGLEPDRSANRGRDVPVRTWSWLRPNASSTRCSVGLTPSK
jgi:CubicO group peptidase (beta-lactamase class C family)